jgi:hypothetical protein
VSGALIAYISEAAKRSALWTPESSITDRGNRNEIELHDWSMGVKPGNDDSYGFGTVLDPTTG